MATVASLTFLSRIAGFARDVLTAAFLGAGPVADAFFVALKLPNLFRRVTAEGAFSVSFVPLYTRTLEEEGEEKATQFAGRSASIMSIGLVFFSALFMIFMPVVISLIAPGFQDDAVRFPLSVELARITFPYLFFISLTALLGGMLNAHNRFAPFAVTPVLFNLAIIAAILIGSWMNINIGYAMAWGISISGFLQLMFVWAFFGRYKIKFHFERPAFTPRIKKLFKLMGPGVLGAGVMRINLFADMIIASLLPAGAISYLYYADRLNQLPLGVVGIAIGTALLPMLSKSLAAGTHENSKNLFNRALEYSLLLALPAAVALFIIPTALIETLFERGEFTSEDTRVTALVLMGYAIGLPPYVLSKTFNTAFWAKENTATPVKISIFITLLNIALAFTLSRIIGVAGIAFATGSVAWIQIALLAFYLRGEDYTRYDMRFIKGALKTTGATLAMAAVLYGVDRFVSLPDMGKATKFIDLIILIGAGFCTYALVILGSGVIKAKDIKLLLKRK